MNKTIFFLNIQLIVMSLNKAPTSDITDVLEWTLLPCVIYGKNLSIMPHKVGGYGEDEFDALSAISKKLSFWCKEHSATELGRNIIELFNKSVIEYEYIRHNDHAGTLYVELSLLEFAKLIADLV